MLDNLDVAYLNNYKSYLKLEKGLSYNTINGYLSDIEKFLTEIEQNSNSITLSNIQDYFFNLVELRIADSTIQRKLSSLKGYFSFLVEEGNELSFALNKLPTIKKSKKLPLVLSVKEMKKLLNSIPTDGKLNARNKAILELMYACGLRVSELIEFSLHDIIWEQQLIRVVGKGNKQRLIPIFREALDYLDFYINHYRARLKKDKLTDIVFLNRSGKKLSRMGIWKIVKKLAHNAGLTKWKKIHPHSVRHSFATHLVENGANLRIVQTLLGHESINTTQIYTNISKSHLKKIYKKYHPRK